MALSNEKLNSVSFLFEHPYPQKGQKVVNRRNLNGNTPKRKFCLFFIKTSKVKVYTEGFRVPVLNRRARGCKSLNLYPIV